MLRRKKKGGGEHILVFTTQFPSSENGVVDTFSVNIISTVVVVVVATLRNNHGCRASLCFRLFLHILGNIPNLSRLLLPLLHLRLPFRLPLRLLPPLHLVPLRRRLPLRPLFLQPLCNFVLGLKSFPCALVFGFVVVVLALVLSRCDEGLLFLLRGGVGETFAFGGNFGGAGGGEERIPILVDGVIAYACFGFGDCR